VPPQSLVPGLPEDLCRLCLELLRYEPDKRPSGEQVLRRLGVEQQALEEVWGTLSLPFVGRQAELGVLHQALEESRQGSSVVVRVQGESGVGKSRLVRRFLDEVAQAWPGVVLLHGRCYERESVPYKGVDGLVDSLARYLAGPGRELASAVLPAQAAPLYQLFPVLRRLAGLKPPGEVPTDPLLLRLAAFTALRELLLRLAARRPVVLGVDDLQWADADSAALLDEVLRAPGLLVVATVRTHSEPHAVEVATSRLWQQARVLELVNLPPEEAQALVRRLCEEEGRLPASEADRIAQESGGHPLFIDALLTAPHRQGQTLSLEQALWARASRLELAARNLLALLAVADGPLHHGVATHAAALDSTEYARATASLRSARLAMTSGPAASDTLEVVHDRVRQAVLPHLEPHVRRAWHVRLASSLEALGQGEPESLARHWHEAGQVERAVSYYLKAARQAEQALAFARAARLYQVALEVGTWEEQARRSLCVSLAEALAHAGRGGEAAQAYLTAGKGAPPQEALLLRRRASEQYFLCGHYEEGLALVRQVLEASGLRYPRSDRAALAALVWQRLQVALLPVRPRVREQVPAPVLERLELFSALGRCLTGVDPLPSLAFQARYVALALRSGERRHLFHALGREVSVAALPGVSGRRRVQQLVQAMREVGAQLPEEPALQGHAALAQAVAACTLGECLEAREHFERTLALFQRCAGTYLETNVVWAVGIWCLSLMGEFTELSRRLALALAEAQERGDLYGYTVLQLCGGPLLRMVVGDSAGARKLADETLSQWKGKGYHYYQHMRDHVWADLYEDAPEAALRRL
jgi:eukaryotic-like serine/threonine-protein kinase